MLAKQEAKPPVKGQPASAKKAAKGDGRKVEAKPDADGKEIVEKEKVRPPKEKELAAAKGALAANVPEKTRRENEEKLKKSREVAKVVAAAKGKMDSSGEAALTEGARVACSRVAQNYRHGTARQFGDLEQGTTSLAGVVYCTGGLDGNNPLNAAEGSVLVASQEDNAKALAGVLRNKPGSFAYDLEPNEDGRPKSIFGYISPHWMLDPNRAATLRATREIGAA